MTGKEGVLEGSKESPPPGKVLKGEKEFVPIRKMKNLGKGIWGVGTSSCKSSSSAHRGPPGWLSRGREGRPGLSLLLFLAGSSTPRS